MTTEYRFPDAISFGTHASPEDGACVMETVALFAGEPFSDHPPCACPVITEFAIRVNDVMPDDITRTRLLGPLVPLIAGSRRDAVTEQRRAFVAADWAVRVFAPLALEANGLIGKAAHLRSLPEIRDSATAETGQIAADAADAADAAYAAAVAHAADAAHAAYAAAVAVHAAAAAGALVAWEQAVACIRAMCATE